MLCAPCYPFGYCRKTKTLVVDDDDLANPDFLRDVRNFAYSLKIKPNQWLTYLADEYMLYPGAIVDKNGHEIFLNFDILEASEGDLFNPHAHNAELKKERMRIWFEEWCCSPCPPHVHPHLRPESRGRVRIVATILKARHPDAAQFWGIKGIAANDNSPAN